MTMENQTKLLPNADSEIIIGPTKRKLWFIIPVSILFVAGGIWMIIDNEPMGWFATSFFGIGSLVFLVQYLPGSTYIKLSRKGFETKTLFRKAFLSWDEVKNFGPVSVGRNLLVGYDFTEEFKGTAKMRDFNKGFAGYESLTPAEYEMNAHDLANLMLKLKVESKS